ncbi:MAG: zinc ribbon domain-containing protein [Candidatus Humimicrobiaceae bacterium]
MLCKKCKKEIPDDSIFCVFCGFEIKTELQESTNKRNKAIPVLATLMSLFLISVIVLSIFLYINVATVENNKKQVSNLNNSNSQLKNDVDRLSNDLNNMTSNYNNLKSDYNNLKDQYQILQNNNKDINNTSLTTEYVSKNTASENVFLNNVNKILNEYSLAVNHINTYHKKNWIYNDPSETALEETFLVKLQELLNQLKNFNYLNSFTNERNNIINLFEQMCSYKQQQIGYYKNNDYSNGTANFNAFVGTVNQLFDYYNSLI